MLYKWQEQGFNLVKASYLLFVEDDKCRPISWGAPRGFNLYFTILKYRLQEIFVDNLLFKRGI